MSNVPVPLHDGNVNGAVQTTTTSNDTQQDVKKLLSSSSPSPSPSPCPYSSFADSLDRHPPDNSNPNVNNDCSQGVNYKRNQIHPSSSQSTIHPSKRHKTRFVDAMPTSASTTASASAPEMTSPLSPLSVPPAILPNVPPVPHLPNGIKNSNDTSNTSSSSLPSATSVTTAKNVLISRTLVIPDLFRVDRCHRLPEYGPRILFFSGGSALKELSIVLKEYTHRSIHLITPFDSGGSSAEIRKCFNMLSVGDLRNRLLALADDKDIIPATSSMTNITGGAIMGSLDAKKSIFDLFAHRLPKGEDGDSVLAARGEFQQLQQGSHPLTRAVSLPMRSILLSFLRWFAHRMPDRFDLRGASIGNLMITGCFLEHNQDIVTAIFLIWKLLGVKGICRPLTGANLHIRAYYHRHNGLNEHQSDEQKYQKDDILDSFDQSVEEEIGQHKMGKHKISKKIIDFDLVQSLEEEEEEEERQQAETDDLGGNDDIKTDDKQKGKAKLLRRQESQICYIDLVSSELVATADVICFPMGSFFGSVLVNLLPHGVGRSIVQRQCPKIYIPNTGADPEMYGYTLSECVEWIIKLVRRDHRRQPQQRQQQQRQSYHTFQHGTDIHDSDQTNDHGANQNDVVGVEPKIDDILNFILIDTRNCEYCVPMDVDKVEAMGITVLDLPLVQDDDHDQHLHNDNNSKYRSPYEPNKNKQQHFDCPAQANQRQEQQPQQQKMRNKATRLDPTKVCQVLLTLGS